MASTASEPLKNTTIQPQMIFKFDDFRFPISSCLVGHNQFRETIKLFLQECAEMVDYKVSGMPIWSTSLVKEENSEVFPLYTIEESVQNSMNTFCVHCQSAGWGNHFVSKRKYHVIIPARDLWDKKLEENFSDIRSHILYGLIHCNGYGHLICINGLGEENGFFSGTETDVMNFWDRICSVLNTRKISVIDSFKKGTMELRLLHVLAFGQTRFGRWGYRLGAGSSRVAEEDIEAATKYLTSVTLDRMIYLLKNKSKGNKINKIISKYRKISKIPLITIGDFLKFLLGFKFRSPTFSETSDGVIEGTCEYDSKKLENSGPIKLNSLAASLAKSCRWPARRIEYVLMVIVNLLERNIAIGGKNLGMSRHTLREETRKCVGDTGLIDFVLKSISCFKTGNHVIRRSINSSTRKVEFKIHELVSEGEPDGVVSPAINVDYIWPVEAVDHAAQKIVDMLESCVGSHPISPLEFHNKARECIGDKSLIDYVLKLISNSMIGSHVLYSSRNTFTKRVKFAMQDVVGQAKIETNGFSPSLETDPGDDVYEDLQFLYRTLLFCYEKLDPIRSAIGILMDSKHFEKEWIIKEQDIDKLMILTCKVLPSFDELETELTRPLSPGVVVEVQSSTTIGELKGIVQLALRDTYCIMDNFVVNQIGGLKAIVEDKVLSSTLKHGDLVWVRGYGLDLDTKLRYEGGPSRI